MPTFGKSFYPHWSIDRSDLKPLADALAFQKFGNNYNPATGLVEFPESKGHLKDDIAVPSPEELTKDSVKYFLERNPNYRLGHELVCLLCVESRRKFYAWDSILKRGFDRTNHSNAFMFRNFFPINMIHRADVSNRNGYPLVGMYSCEYLPVHVNGAPEYVGYLGGLRVNQPYRQKVRILKSGFASIHHLVPVQDAAPFLFTSVASENSPARRLLEAGLKGMPVYRSLGEMETLAFNTRQGKLQGLLQQAVPEDIPAMVDFFNLQASRYQFSPVLTKE